MKEIFVSLWKTAGGKNGATVYDDLEKHYSAENRYYHNLHHIENSLIYSNMGKNILALELAIFFHDIIYDATKRDNEEQSAEYFAKVARKSGLQQKLVEEVERLILATKHQKKPDDFDGMLICDIDLSEMGKNYEVFSKNDRLIRKEYSAYSNDEYKKGQHQLMSRLLTKPDLFYTDEFKTYEKVALENIERYLAE